MEKLTEIEEFYFLSRIFPCTVYFKVDYLTHIDMESALQKIFKNISRDCNNHLRLLCFHDPVADDKLVKRLDKMINDEKLVFNCIVKTCI